MRKLPLLALFALLSTPSQAQTEPSAWQPYGLLRIRDLTPFGITRLDMLPAHAVAAAPGTFALELTTSYQNTWVLSENVEELLAARGEGRRTVRPEDVEAILALEEDAYVVDGELGLLDVTAHYRFTEHLGGYLTIPYFFFESGFLDRTIEDFHREAGFSSAGRDLVTRDQFLVVADVAGVRVVLTDEPADKPGDPVFGLRWSLFAKPRAWNLVLEGAAKIALESEDRLVSSGANDYGVQLSLQRFNRRSAFYLTVSGVYFASPDPELAEDQLIPTVILGWENKVTRHTNVVLQLYASRSTVQRTPISELSDDKFQLTLGFQSRRGNRAWRFGITENIANFGNTPDVGVSLAFAQIFPGR